MQRITYYLLIVALTMMLFTVCQLPENQPPSSYVLLSQLLRPETIPDYRLSLILDGREYRPGDRIELGSSPAFTEKVVTIIAKNTGKFGFSIKTGSMPIVTSSTSGNLNIRTDSNPPEPWNPGMEFTIRLHVTPDGNSENLWNFTIQTVSPVANDFSFNLSMLSLVTQPKKLFFSALSTPSGLYSWDWNSSTDALESEVQYTTGNGNLIATAMSNRFVYYMDSTSSSLIGKTINSSGALADVPSAVIAGGYNHFQEIRNRNRLLALNPSSQMGTIDFNPDTGGAGSFVPTIGTACYSDSIFVTPKGDFVLQPFPGVGTGRIQVSRVENNGTLFNPFPYYQDANVSNRNDLHFKTLNNDYLYAFSRTGAPGGNNLKVDNLLRRTLSSDGSISNVNAEYTLNSFGAAYRRSIVHPNDKFIYLLGKAVSGVSFIKVLNHNIDTGDITVVQNVERSSTVDVYEGSISPDGKLLAIVHWNNTSGICPSVCLRTVVVYSINQSNGTLTELHALPQSRTVHSIGWLGSN